MKIFFLITGISLLTFGFFPLEVHAQGEFFGGSSSNNSDEEQTQNKNEKPPLSVSSKSEEISTSPLTILDRVKIRVNNSILTERQFSIFYALRKLSPFLSTTKNEQEALQAMTQVLGLEAFAKMNNLYNLLPTRSEMKNRIDYFLASIQVGTLSQAAAKIDPSGSLAADDFRKFFYYQILREKGFVYALQKDFMGKIFTPREDEILLLYKQIAINDPKIFHTPIQLYIRNIAIVEPANEQAKRNVIRRLENAKKEIDTLPTFREKQHHFIQDINTFSSSHLKNPDAIGPLDEELVSRDFPEYKGLFALKKGGTSSVITQDGFIRLVFIDSKEEGKMKSVDDPDIRQRLTGIIYNNKGETLFEGFLKDNLSKMDVEIVQGDNNEKF